MAFKQIQCREHGGMFRVVTKRGRQPVRCSAANECDMVPQTSAQHAKAEKPAGGTATVVKHNPSIVLARKAKDLLEPQDWDVKGRAWNEDGSAYAEVSAQRGEETMRIVWKDGKFLSQDYSLWDADKTPGQNGRPVSRLPFNPNELTDAELARELAGRTVTWWNRLAQNTETAVIGDQFRIDHAYTGGNETARQVHFVDKTPNHHSFRAFNVDALMKVR